MEASKIIMSVGISNTVSGFAVYMSEDQRDDVAGRSAHTSGWVESYDPEKRVVTFKLGNGGSSFHK